MKQEQGAASTALDQDMNAMGGDTDEEQTNKESTSTILTTPQTLNSFFFGKLTYVLKEEDTNIIRGIPQIYNDNRNIKQQMATG